MRNLIIALALAISFVLPAASAQADEKNILLIDTKYGQVVVLMRPDLAPNHVKRIRTLANKGFYDGVKFHRVIAGFMAQTGDRNGNPPGTGGSSLPDLKAEFNSEPHVRGVASMARGGSPDSANSQFFIVLKDSNFLDGKYTVWGQVIRGMEFIDKIKKGAGGSGSVRNPDVMVKVRAVAKLK